MTEAEIDELLASIREERADKAEGRSVERHGKSKAKGFLTTERSGVIREPPTRGECPETLKIQRIAMSQSLVDISDKITKEHFGLLCDLLTYHYESRRRRTERLITEYVEGRLSLLIPNILRKAYEDCPCRVKRMPSFVYKADESKPIVISLDLPYYLRQGTERATLDDNMDETQRAKLGELVAMYHRYCDKSKAKVGEVKNAVYGQRRFTYYGILRAKPQWFYILYTELLRRKEENDGCSDEERDA